MKMPRLSLDMQVIHRVIVESLKVTGYEIAASKLTIEPSDTTWVVKITVEVER